MIKLARGSVSVSLLALIVGFFYVQPEMGAAFSIAKDSQDTFNQKNEEILAADSKAAEEIENISYIKDTTENKAVKSDSISISKASSYRATAYCLQGRTAGGGGVRRGIVAADSRILPLGTRIQITAGSYSGTYVVADTGGAIRGRILDVWVPSCSEAKRFGRKTVTVSVLGRGGKKGI